MAMFIDRHAVASRKQAHAPSQDSRVEVWQKCKLTCDMNLLHTRFPGQRDNFSDGGAVETNSTVQQHCKHP